MTDAGIVLFITSIILIGLQSRKTSQRILHLQRVVRILERELAEALHLLQIALSRDSERVPAPPDMEEADRWRVAWAKEVLRVQEGDLSEDRIRRARAQAIKTSHPDAGGTAERLSDIETAVEVLRSAL